VDGPRAHADGATNSDAGRPVAQRGDTCGGPQAGCEEAGGQEAGRPKEGRQESRREEASEEGGQEEARQESRQEGCQEGLEEGGQEEEGRQEEEAVILSGRAVQGVRPGALRISGALALLCLWGWAGLPAQAVNPDAALVYRRLAPRVVKVQAVEKSSGAKAAIGSGFFVSASGEVVTNYHVVSALVNQPDRYRADLIDSRDVSRPVEILAIDVVHDLAVLSVEPAGDPWFDLVPTAVERGTRLYSMGHPLDLGLSIVEGTYNGLLEHTLYPRIHFTGSINPGMSGGPTVTADGAVVGVNVSTAGEQVSFLVPAARVVALLREVRRADYRRPDSLLQTVASQLLAYQDTYLASLFADSTPTIALGGYLVPTRPAPFFKCWGDATHAPLRAYDTIEHQCSTDDYVFISEDQWSGVLQIRHTVLTSRDLGRMRFYALYSSQFEGDGLELESRDVVTPQRCTVGNVRQNDMVLKTVFCARRYRKLPGLYDAYFKVAALGAPDSGLVTTLTLSGVTFANARRVVERYLASISKAPR
jgi:serine protease Do